MKLNKIISGCASSKNDSSMPIVALLAGLAVGAVVGMLFAPESGADIRGKISDKAGDLAESVKDKVQTVKDKFSSEVDHAVEVKDQVVGDLRKKTKDVADHLQGNQDQPGAAPDAPQNI
ncbi:YtxH domain-containing protein [Pedobacter sp.]|uniref:YtxH domain-containing protein n=1 Tax=Pedobacter sp. TaxID=1411316 RepID=UPI003D7F8B71